MLYARFDGGCDANPGGNGACACTINNENGEEVYRSSRYLGCGPKMSNNVAEFAGAYLIIEWLALNEITEKINIIGDSMIVVNRMKKGHGRKMKGLYAPMALQCLDTLKLVKTKITWSWQPRAHNHTCDLLCSEEMKSARERKANRADLKNVAALGERIARDDRRDHAN